MTDFRALCDELIDALDSGLTAGRICMSPAANRARAALAERRPSTDGEVREAVKWLGVISEQFRLADLNDQAVQTDRAADLLERLADGPAVPESREPASVTTDPSDQQLYDLADQLNGEPVASMRAALARWGRPTPQPVPVTERLPEKKDCNAEGRCWWWYDPVPEQPYGYWVHEDDATDRAVDEWPTHWLPAHALPLPAAEVE